MLIQHLQTQDFNFNMKKLAQCFVLPISRQQEDLKIISTMCIDMQLDMLSGLSPAQLGEQRPDMRINKATVLICPMTMDMM